MTKTNSSKNGKFRFLFIIPAIAIALSLNLQCTSENENKDNIDLNTTEIITKNGVERVSIESIEMPQFPNGEKALQIWIAENVKYPAEAQEKNIEGRVYVGFVVNKEGSVEEVKLMRGVSPSIDAEALRVVSEMPKWKPGSYQKEPISMNFTVPINFALK